MLFTLVFLVIWRTKFFSYRTENHLGRNARIYRCSTLEVGDCSGTVAGCRDLCRGSSLEACTPAEAAIVAVESSTAWIDDLGGFYCICAGKTLQL